MIGARSPPDHRIGCASRDSVDPEARPRKVLHREMDRATSVLPVTRKRSFRVAEGAEQLGTAWRIPANSQLAAIEKNARTESIFIGSVPPATFAVEERPPRLPTDAFSRSPLPRAFRPFVRLALKGSSGSNLPVRGSFSERPLLALLRHSKALSGITAFMRKPTVIVDDFHLTKLSEFLRQIEICLVATSIRCPLEACWITE